MPEDQAIDRQPGDQHGADGESGRADHAEKAQGLLREAHQEEHREDIQHPVYIVAQRIAAVVTVARRLLKIDLDHAETQSVGQHRQEAVLISIERDLFQDAPLHRARATAQIVEPLARDRGNDPMEGVPAHPLESPSGARPATAD